MRWTDVPYSTRDNLLRMYQSRQQEELHKAAGILGINAETIKRRLREHRLMQTSIIPHVPTKVFNDYLQVETDDAIIISDIELPDHDSTMLSAALLMGKRYHIKTLIIAGDLVATDQSSLNSWEEVIKIGDEPPFQRVIEITKQLLASFREQFQDILLIEGNHDDRIARKTGGEVHLGMLLGDNIQYSRYSYMWVKTSRGYVYVTHPQNYSATSVGLGQRLYNVTAAPDGSKPHIVLAHTHHAQQGRSPDGLREIHALGTMRDPNKTKYKSTRSNTHHQWTQGFLMLKHGYFYPFIRGSTDWEFYLAELCPSELRNTN